jgi:hypothetical protein
MLADPARNMRLPMYHALHGSGGLFDVGEVDIFAMLGGSCQADNENQFDHERLV